jgi:hypothetical protein
MNGVGSSANGGEPGWVVVLEAATTTEGSSLYRMLELLSDVHGIALHCPNRYAIQMEIDAGGQPEALFVAFSHWQLAHARVGDPPPPVVRSEVLCREEFERDCGRASDGLAQVEAADRSLRLLSS